MSRRLLLVAAVFALLVIAWWRTPARDPTPRADSVDPATERLPVKTGGPIASAVAPVTEPSPTEPRSALADRLNAADGTLQADLKILQEILAAWRSNWPREGNPVGENAEITTALTGENSLQLALIPKDHPAIDRAGALCDRWGTPFRFHQVSAMQMEVRSAGPDRRFGTADDAQF